MYNMHIIPYDKNFDVSLTLFCGQAFRWKETEEGWHGVAFGKPLTIKKSPEGLIFSCSSEDFELIWKKE